MDKAWSAEWLRRFSAADPASLMDLYRDDASFEDVTLGQRVSGKTDLAAFFGAFMNRAERKLSSRMRQSTSEICESSS